MEGISEKGKCQDSMTMRIDQISQHAVTYASPKDEIEFPPNGNNLYEEEEI